LDGQNYPHWEGGAVEVAKLILEYLKVLVWPLITLSIAATYRTELVAILGRLKKAGLPGGVSLDFAEEAKEIRYLSDQVLALPSKPEAKGHPTIPLNDANARMISLGLQPSPSGLDMEYYRTLAAQDPNIALAGLRIEIDILARNLAKGFKVAVSPRESGLRLLRHLLEADAIDKTQFDLVEKVARVCNAAAHGNPVSREQADSVITSAAVLSKQYLEWLSWGFEDGWKPSAMKPEPPNKALNPAGLRPAG
jgi:hypothetical protein